MQGFSRKNQFYVLTTPATREAEIDFVKFVKEYNIGSIVVLDEAIVS